MIPQKPSGHTSYILNVQSLKDCLKTNGKETIKMPKTGEYIKF